MSEKRKGAVVAGEARGVERMLMPGLLNGLAVQ